MKNIFTATNLIAIISSAMFALPAIANPGERIPTIFHASSSVEKNDISSVDSNAETILVATVTNSVQFDLGQDRPQKIDLVLAQPFKGFPTGSRIRAIVQPLEDGNAVLIADLLYSEGNFLRINADSEVLYGQTVTVSDRATEATKRTATAAPFGGLASLTLGKDAEETIQYSGAAGLIGRTVGILSPQEIQLLDLSANSLILFTLN